MFKYLVILWATVAVGQTASAQSDELSAPNQVLAIQGLLNGLGFNTGTPDGVLGPSTRDAIRRFESAAGLPADGVLDRRTAQVIVDISRRVDRIGGSSASMEWRGHPFSLRDVERRCEVWRWSANWGDVECRSGTWEDEVEDECDVWFPNSNSNKGEIDCDESAFRPIERCSAVAPPPTGYGTISC